MISGANFIALLALLATAVGSWNTMVTAVAKTDLLVASVKDQLTEVKNKVDQNTTWQATITSRIAVLETKVDQFIVQWTGKPQRGSNGRD